MFKAGSIHFVQHPLVPGGVEDTIAKGLPDRAVNFCSASDGYLEAKGANNNARKNVGVLKALPSLGSSCWLSVNDTYLDGLTCT